MAKLLALLLAFGVIAVISIRRLDAQTINIADDVQPQSQMEAVSGIQHIIWAPLPRKCCDRDDDDRTPAANTNTDPYATFNTDSNPNTNSDTYTYTNSITYSGSNGLFTCVDHQHGCDLLHSADGHLNDQSR